MLVGAAGLGNGICLVVALFPYILAEVFVVYFMTVFALNGGSGFFSEFHLRLALALDCLVGKLESVEQFSFRNFVHFAFNHHYIFVCSTYHQIHVSFFELFESWVDNELAIDTGNAHFGNRTIERNVANGKSC